MFSPRRIIIIGLLSFFVTYASPAAAQLRKLNIAYTSTSPYSAPLIVAKEAGLFKNTAWSRLCF